ncbi:MAG: MBL fold metallo-hydrolase, partial [Holophagales bacterium]|nr:MBL fold metallo-hydrolase [Holophagales bacterium]
MSPTSIPSAESEPSQSAPRSFGGMRLAVLGSGSRGNAFVVESGGESLLVDAGFSCRDLTRRLASLGHSPDRLGALLLTHEHGDHARGADVLARRHRLPLFATEGTLREVSLRPEARELA